MYWSIAIIFKGFGVWFYMELADYLARRLSEHIRGGQIGVSFGGEVYGYSDKFPAEFSVRSGIKIMFREQSNYIGIDIEGSDNEAVLDWLENNLDVRLDDKDGLQKVINYPIPDGGRLLERISSTRKLLIDSKRMFIEPSSERSNHSLIDVRLGAGAAEADYCERVFQALNSSILSPILKALLNQPSNNHLI